MATNIIISTTSTLDGYEIQQYLGVMSAHVVAGTGLFSDMFGGARDFFGGHSKSYQKQLERIEQTALHQLKQKAQANNANGVIGIRIDHDNISGKGTQMFMVTASGTLVRVKRKSEEKVRAFEKDGTVTSDRLNAELKKERFLEDAQNGKLRLTTEELQFIMEEQIVELVPYFFDRIEKMSKDERYVNGDFKEFESKIESVILSMDADKLENELYNLDFTNPRIFQFAKQLIQKRKIANYDKIIELLDSSDFVIQKRSVELLACDKEYYTSEDLEKLKIIVEKLELNFPAKARIESKKGIVSNKEKEFWYCFNCNTKNDIEHEICKKPECRSDKYGFKKNELTSRSAKKVIQKAVHHLEKHLM